MSDHLMLSHNFWILGFDTDDVNGDDNDWYRKDIKVQSQQQRKNSEMSLVQKGGFIKA